MLFSFAFALYFLALYVYGINFLGFISSGVSLARLSRSCCLRRSSLVRRSLSCCVCDILNQEEAAAKPADF